MDVPYPNTAHTFIYGTARFTFDTVELELELILSRWLWERGEKSGASLQKQARVRCVVQCNGCVGPLKCFVGFLSPEGYSGKHTANRNEK